MLSCSVSVAIEPRFAALLAEADDVRHVQTQDLPGVGPARPVHPDHAIAQAARSADGRIEVLVAVGGADDHDVAPVRHPVQFGEDRTEHLVADALPPRPAHAAYRVDFLHAQHHEPVRRPCGLFAQLAEDQADPLFGFAEVLVVQLAGTQIHDRLHAEIPGESLQAHGLPVAGRPVQDHSPDLVHAVLRGDLVVVPDQVGRRIEGGLGGPESADIAPGVAGRLLQESVTRVGARHDRIRQLRVAIVGQAVVSLQLAGRQSGRRLHQDSLIVRFEDQLAIRQCALVGGDVGRRRQQRRHFLQNGVLLLGEQHLIADPQRVGIEIGKQPDHLLAVAVRDDRQGVLAHLDQPPEDRRMQRRTGQDLDQRALLFLDLLQLADPLAKMRDLPPASTRLVGQNVHDLLVVHFHRAAQMVQNRAPFLRGSGQRHHAQNLARNALGMFSVRHSISFRFCV